MTGQQTGLFSIRNALIILLMAVLGGCASNDFKAEVNRFQRLPAPTGQSFVVTSNDPELRGGLEFAYYAKNVEENMIQQGYVIAEDPATADMVVTFDYNIDNGREKVRSTGTGYPHYGWGGAYRSRYYYGFYDPFLYGPGYNDVYSFTVYTTELQMKIDRVADNVRLFEGSAQAQSRSKRLTYIVPNLVEAIFTDFPGNSGETVRISLAPEEQAISGN